MSHTIDDIGLEMYQEGDELIWEMSFGYHTEDCTYSLQLTEECLERLLYRLADELEVMLQRKGYTDANVHDVSYGLPEGTDTDIELTPDSGDDMSAAIDAFASFDEEL